MKGTMGTNTSTIIYIDREQRKDYLKKRNKYRKCIYVDKNICMKTKSIAKCINSEYRYNCKEFRNKGNYLCLECKNNNNGWCIVKKRNDLKKLNIVDCIEFKKGTYKKTVKSESQNKRKYLCSECKNNNYGWCVVKKENGLRQKNISKCKDFNSIGV